VPVHVRVRDGRTLRDRVEAVGTHADVAMRAGLAPARLSQILSETAPVIKVHQAARLEDVLGVPRGTFFALDDPEADACLLAAYVDVDVPKPAEPADNRSMPVECGEG
jgi:hypothetical protein